MQHTGNSLVDSILTLQLSRAGKLGAYVERDFTPLKEPIPIEDSDLTALLMNITDNALEALERMDEPYDRWLCLRIDHTGDLFAVECENAAVMGEKQFVKADRQAHGFGIPLIRSVAAQYNGSAVFQRQADSFFVTVSLPITKKQLQRG